MWPFTPKVLPTADTLAEVSNERVAKLAVKFFNQEVMWWMMQAARNGRFEARCWHDNDEVIQAVMPVLAEKGYRATFTKNSVRSELNISWDHAKPVRRFKVHVVEDS